MRHLEHFHELKSPTRKRKFSLLSLLPVYFMVIGLFLQPVRETGPGIVHLIKEPDLLITNYFIVSGVGTTLINAGTLILTSIGIIYFIGIDMDGHVITSNYLMSGSSLFGRDLLNIWAILAGAYLCARYHKMSIRRYIYVGLYGASLSSIITQVMQMDGLPLVVWLVIAPAVGLVISFALPSLSAHVYFAHKEYSLCNVGSAAGIIAIVIMSVLRSFGVKAESRLIWFTGSNEVFGIVLSILFGGVIVLRVTVRDRSVWGSYNRIIKSYGIGGTGYLRDEDGASTVFNMGANGLFTTYFMLTVGSGLSEPTICGVFAAVSFEAMGRHLRSITPMMMGVYPANLTKTWDTYQPSPILALLFSTILAPMAGRFGVVVGIMAGYLHSPAALDTGIVYGGMNLYNNGCAGGIATIFMVLVIRSVVDRWTRTRGGLSLWEFWEMRGLCLQK